MKLTVQVKLCPSPQQASSLLQTLERANDAANFVSNWSFQHRTFHKYSVQKALYFRSGRAGRERIPYLCYKRARLMLLSQQGETDLVFRDNRFFLNTTINAPEPLRPDTAQVQAQGQGGEGGVGQGQGQGWLGVDMGIVNIAVDSEGTVYSGAHVKSIRYRNRRLRAKLQSKGTRAAKRLLRRRRAKENRFARHTNHTISKRIVATAKALGKGIAVEELSGIRDRAPVTVRHSQRASLHSWSFHQLRSFIEYKAQLAGIRVCAVNPRNTSRTCPMCGCIDKANRPSQSQFLCISCGYAAMADANAARNIASRAAAVSQPYLSRPLYPQGEHPQGEARARSQAKAVPL